MKIKSCEIRSFGKLENKTLNFSDKITIIRGKNESGKTTVSSFIKYVLYGYSGKGRDERNNEKLHYTPWSGKDSAGALVVELSSGEVYRAERSSKGHGEVKVLNSAGSECFAGLEPGEAFCGIDLSTFSKSAFVAQSDIDADGMKDIGASIEKLLLDADEDASCEKAEKTLISARNTLYNKMRSTGKIFELSEKLSELQRKKEDETENHKSLVAAKYSVKETEKIVLSNKSQLETLYSEAENIDAYEAEETLLKINTAKKKCDEYEADFLLARQKADYGSFVPDRKYVDELSRAFSEFLIASPEIMRSRGALSDSEIEYRLFCDKLYSNNFSEGESTKKVHGITKEAETLYKSSLKLRNIGIILCVPIITIPLAIVLLVMSGNKKKKLSKILSDYGFESFDELSRYDENYEESCTELERIKAENARLKRICEEKEVEYSICDGLLREKLEKISYPCETGDLNEYSSEIKDKLIPELREYVFELERIQGMYDKEKNALDALLSVSDVEKLEILSQKKQSEMPNRTKETVDREIKYLEGANALLEKKLSELGVEIARLEATGSDADALAEEIAKLEEELSECILKRDALDMALDIVEKSRNDIRSGVLPKIASRAGELFEKFTGGKYRSLFFDKDFRVSVLEAQDTETRKIGYLSAGAIDTAYIALRIALTERFCREKPAIVFDDSFANADDTRLENILSVLSALSEEYQIIILTCHTREEKILKDKAKLIVFDNADA